MVNSAPGAFSLSPHQLQLLFFLGFLMAIGGFGAALALLVPQGWRWVNSWRVRHGKSKLMFEPVHLIVLGLLIAIVGVVWHQFWWQPTTATSIPGSSAASIGRDGPFVFGADIGNSGKPDEPIIFVGRVQQTQKLSFYVQYITTIRGQEWSKSALIPLESKEILRDTPISIPVITRRIESSGGPAPRSFWGMSKYPVQSSVNVYILLSVVVIGPNGHEQVVRAALHHQESDSNNEEKFSASPMLGFPYVAAWLSNSDKVQ